MKLYVQERGSGHPVVFLHAGLMDGRMWEAELAAVAKSYRAIRIDAPGHGLSEAPKGPYVAYEQIAAALRQRGVERATIVGSSVGGRIAIDLAIAHPELVGGLLLAGSGLSGWPVSQEMKESLAPIVENRGELVDFCVMFLAHKTLAPRRDRPDARVLVDTMLRDNFATLSHDASWFRELDPPAIGRLREVHAKTLVVVGGSDEPYIHAIAETLTKGIRGAKQVVVPNARHLVNLDEPKAFLDLLLDFLPPPKEGSGSKAATSRKRSSHKDSSN